MSPQNFGRPRWRSLVALEAGHYGLFPPSGTPLDDPPIPRPLDDNQPVYHYSGGKEYL